MCDRVRKACTESMVDMAKAVGPEVTSEQLTEVFLRLSRDSSKLVRDGALQVLLRNVPGYVYCASGR